MHLQQYSLKQIWIAICVSLGAILCGMAGGWSAPIIHKLQDLKQSPLPGVITDKEASWIGSSVFIGIIIGPYLSGYLTNKIGRKPCLLLGGIIIVFSNIILATSVNIAMILVGRIISGIGCGIVFVSNLVYMSEIASTKIRGAIISLTGVATSSGTLLSYSVCPYVSYSSSSYMALALAIIFTGGVAFIPETPVFFLLKGKTQKAREVLTYLGRTEDIDDLLTKKLDTIASKQDWIKIFTIKNNRKTLFITLTLTIFQNCSGAYVLMAFATSVFDLVETDLDPNVSTVVTGVTMLLASCITPTVVDKYGRRVVLLLSTAVSCLSMMLLGLYFFLDHFDHCILPHLQMLPVISLVIFFLSFNCGFAVIPNTLMSEMYQSDVRGPGSTVTLTTAWIFGWTICTSFGYMKTSLGIHVTLWLYSAVCCLAFIFTAVFVPETKGKSFAEIQCILSK